MNKVENKIGKLQEKRKGIFERYEKAQANLAKIQEELDKCDKDILKYQEELNILEMKDLIAEINSKGLNLNDLRSALLKGDLLELQEKLEENKEKTAGETTDMITE